MWKHDVYSVFVHDPESVSEGPAERFSCVWKLVLVLKHDLQSSPLCLRLRRGEDRRRWLSVMTYGFGCEMDGGDVENPVSAGLLFMYYQQQSYLRKIDIIHAHMPELVDG